MRLYTKRGKRSRENKRKSKKGQKGSPHQKAGAREK